MYLISTISSVQLAMRKSDGKRECTRSGSDTQRLELEVHVVGKIKEQLY